MPPITSAGLRIVSFLPSATETIFALGLGKNVVGVTHECNFPLAARKKPKVITPTFEPADLTSSEIDQTISRLSGERKNVFSVNREVMRSARPDIIIAQGLCNVCSPFTAELEESLSLLENKPKVLVLNPHSLEDILHSIVQIGDAVGKHDAAKRLATQLHYRIKSVRDSGSASNARVLCVEWLEPLYTAGHWIPEMVDLAGGINGISIRGQESRKMDISEVAEFDPDIIFLMPCGFNASRTIQETKTLSKSKEWKSLRAVRDGKVYALDSDYFSKPGPRTIQGLEIMAKIISPHKIRDVKLPRGSYKKLRTIG